MNVEVKKPEGRVLPTPAEAHDLELERGLPTLFVGDGPAQATRRRRRAGSDG